MKLQYKLAMTMFCLVLFIVASNVQAQEAPADTSYWAKSGIIGLNLSTVGLNDGWKDVQGGANNIAIGLLANYTAKYQKEANLWTTLFEGAYGTQKVGEATVFSKTEDVLHINSTYGRQLKPKWYGTASLDFRTQFDKGLAIDADAGTSAEISSFMSPGFLSGAVGVMYKHEFDKEDFLTVNFAPISFKTTIVSDESLFNTIAEADGSVYGVAAGSSSVTQFGLMTITANFQKKLADNIRFTSGLTLFTPYEKIGNFDVNWDNLLIMKVTKYITTNVSFSLIYDEDILADIQSKYGVGVGIAYTIGG